MRPHGETDEESSKKEGGKGTKGAETPMKTTVMFKCKDGLMEDCVKRKEKADKRGGVAFGVFLFFSLPCYIVLKSVSICNDGWSSVEEVQEYDSNHNDSNNTHHDHHLAVLPPVLVF